MGSYLSLITLNINGLNAPTKRQRLAEWIQKQDPYICCLQEIHLKTGDTYRLKVKGWKKIFHANRDQKKAGVAMLISDKIDFIVLGLSLYTVFVFPVQRISFSICWRAGLMVLNSLSFYLSVKLLTSSYLNEILAGYSNLAYRLFSFINLSMSCQSLPA